MKIQTQIFKFDGDLWHYAIEIPKEVAELFIEGNDKRVICKLSKEVWFHGALMPLGNGNYFINLNAERRKKLGLVHGQVIDVELEKDNSEYGMPMSEELREVLNQDDEANEIFHSLTPGRQRTLIYWVDNVKSSDIKIRRAFVLTNHMKTADVLDFKTLNSDLKEANQRAKLGKL